ncbi:MAG: cysteine desulfurase family protein [Flavobacteriales bacterium]
MIYLDNNATTKLDPRVLEAMMPFLTEEYGNPASNHAFGVSVNQYVRKAREQVASLIGCEPFEITFTSGATEAINLALKGLVAANTSERRHIVTCQTEHSAVLDTCRYLETQGIEVTYLPVQPDGLIDLEVAKAHIRPNTLVVSIMLVNNETGVIQPIKELAVMAHEQGAYFMSDATQAVGKMSVLVNDLGVDLMAFSAHKFYGPKGIGALYARSRRPHKVKLLPLLHGGGHERGIRSGTLNTPGIIGMGAAAAIAAREMKADAERIGTLRAKLERALLSIPGTQVNGNSSTRLYNTTNLSFDGVDADALVVALKDRVMLTNGSACHSNAHEPSHVLTAMDRNRDHAYSAVRFSLSRFSTGLDVQVTTKSIQSIVNALRQMV